MKQPSAAAVQEPPLPQRLSPVEIDSPRLTSTSPRVDFARRLNVIAQVPVRAAVCGRVCPQSISARAMCARGIKANPSASAVLERFSLRTVPNNESYQACCHPPTETRHKEACHRAGPSRPDRAATSQTGLQDHQFTRPCACAPAALSLRYGSPEFTRSAQGHRPARVRGLKNKKNKKKK